ncbi:MAG: hypothetical protein BWX90_00737 [bacterium ADurb.Bin132]|nr:MAG: hypothetical protein BWX90_00737 [bacterium ADurb.Bin132]
MTLCSSSLNVVPISATLMFPIVLTTFSWAFAALFLAISSSIFTSASSILALRAAMTSLSFVFSSTCLTCDSSALFCCFSSVNTLAMHFFASSSLLAESACCAASLYFLRSNLISASLISVCFETAIDSAAASVASTRSCFIWSILRGSIFSGSSILVNQSLTFDCNISLILCQKPAI